MAGRGRISKDVNRRQLMTHIAWRHRAYLKQEGDCRRNNDGVGSRMVVALVTSSITTVKTTGRRTQATFSVGMTWRMAWPDVPILLCLFLPVLCRCGVSSMTVGAVALNNGGVSVASGV